MESAEKVICCDRGNNDALLASMLNNNNAWANNPFAYLMFLSIFRNFNGYGENGGENFNSRQIAALQDVVNTNHNNDLAMQALANNQDAVRELAQAFNTSLGNIQMAVCNVKSAVEQVAGATGFSAERVINAVNLGDANMMQQMQQCCCQTKTAILEQGYQSQLAIERQTNGIQAQMAANHSSEQLQACQNQNQTIAAINNIGTLLQQGFTQLGYSGQQNTQRIIDHLATQKLRHYATSWQKQVRRRRQRNNRCTQNNHNSNNRSVTRGKTMGIMGFSKSPFPHLIVNGQL